MTKEQIQERARIVFDVTNPPEPILYSHIGVIAGDRTILLCGQEWRGHVFVRLYRTTAMNNRWIVHRKGVVLYPWCPECLAVLKALNKQR